MLGEQKFYEYIRRFGFGDRTGIELPGEIRGMVHAPRSWSKISITRIPMGQEVGVTPLQMLLAMATVANGGTLIQPRIVKTVIDDRGKALAVLKPTFVRQVISPQTASQVALALRGVVSKRGTAAEAAVPGFTMGIFTFFFFALVIVGASNAVNLTDGLDGLAIGCTITVAFAYALLAYAAGNFRIAQYLQVPFYPFSGELAVVCAALVGAGLGFLWFNCHPAKVFMHGKTTTAAMAAHVLRGGGLHPSHYVGAEIPILGSNAHWDARGGFFVAEGDESDGTLQLFQPEHALILNVEEEHLDFYRDLAAIEMVFRKLLARTKGIVFFCADDLHATRICEPHQQAISYGFSESAQYRATGLELHDSQRLRGHHRRAHSELQQSWLCQRGRRPRGDR